MSKRKWDQTGEPSEEGPSKVSKTEDGKTASEAAAAAAAIAAKIAAQFSNKDTPPPPSSSAPAPPPPDLSGRLDSNRGLNVTDERKRDPHDAEFTYDIEINDVRNRYMLTKGSTQQEIYAETSASVTTKGVWYPDKSKATDKDPPLYLHISATTQEILDKAIQRINDLIAMDLGPLVEDRRKDFNRERRKWLEEKIPINLESLRNFNVRAKVVGPQGMFVKHIQQETGTRVQIKGLGSGFFETDTGRESEEPMHIHITGPDEGQIKKAKELAHDLLDVVRQEWAKASTALNHQSMGMQGQYAAYAAAYYGAAAAAPPPPGDAPPPPPPGDAPPPPPDGQPPAPPGGPAPGGGAPGQAGTVDYMAYWAAYGYDVNSEAFKQWYAQTMAASGGQGTAGAAPPGPA